MLRLLEKSKRGRETRAYGPVSREFGEAVQTFQTSVHLKNGKIGLDGFKIPIFLKNKRI